MPPYFFYLKNSLLNIGLYHNFISVITMISNFFSFQTQYFDLEVPIQSAFAKSAGHDLVNALNFNWFEI